MSAIADLDRLIAAAIARNATILRGDRMLEALLPDGDHLPADLIRTGRAQAALRLAREAAPEQELTVHRAMSRARTALQRRLIARLIG